MLAKMGRSTVDPIRQGFDTQGSPGEQSLNQAGVWKRTVMTGSWVLVRRMVILLSLFS